MESSVSRQVNAIINDKEKPAHQGETREPGASGENSSTKGYRKDREGESQGTKEESSRSYGENAKNPRTKGGIRSLGDITLKAETVKAELAALFAKEPELADDQYLRQCMVEGETNAYEFMEDLLTTVTELEILIEGIAQSQRAMAERRARFVRRAEAMRGLMLGVLKGSGLPKIELPTATPTVRAGSERVEVADVDLIPDQYLRKEPKLAEIKDALKAGTQIAGCALTTGPDTLTIYNR